MMLMSSMCLAARTFGVCLCVQLCWLAVQTKNERERAPSTLFSRILPPFHQPLRQTSHQAQTCTEGFFSHGRGRASVRRTESRTDGWQRRREGCPLQLSAHNIDTITAYWQTKGVQTRYIIQHTGMIVKPGVKKIGFSLRMCVMKRGDSLMKKFSASSFTY